ncbi:MAG: YgjV family protein [Candidatus Gracilibacteria bacterium]|nr:YgjV family protein [Candidatus Gracilibacteria bacterium]
MQEIINNIIEIFNANPVAQTFGLIAFIVQIFGVINKDDKKLILFQSFASIFWIVHFGLMGLFITSVIAFINMMRGFTVLKFPKNIKIFLIFVIIYGINAVYNYQNLSSILAIVASFTALYAFFFLSGKGILFRLTLFGVGITWMAYHFLNHSIGGVMTEITMTSLNLLTVFRLYRDKINLKNNLNLELEPELVEINKK